MKTSLLFPMPCTACGYNICYDELPFCSECLSDLQRLLTARCRVCHNPPSACVCPENKELRFAFFYNGFYARRLIYANKKKPDPRLTDFWAELAVRASGVKPKSYDAVAFVPRLRRNKRKYGCDQAELFAKSLSKLYGIPIIYALERIGGSEQKLLSRAERYKNMVGRFKLREDFPKGLNYNKILLVDDVCTTGATINACAGILRGSVARGVVPFVLAKTD